MAEPEQVREPAAETVARPPARRGGFWSGLIGGLLGGAAVIGGGGWWAVEHGPVTPALERLASAEAATRAAETGIATLGGKLDELGTSFSGKLDELGTNLGGLGTELGGTKAALERADGAIAALGQKLAAAESTTAELAGKVEQADRAFRAAADQVTARLEAVNAKLVEVEQSQPADVVDKQTVADLVAKQTGVDDGQKAIAAGLARLEQLMTQGLAAGNQQAVALQTMVQGAQSRMEEIGAQQRDLLAMRADLDAQADTDREQTAALDGVAAEIGAIRAELQEMVQGARSELQQQLADTSARLTTEGADRERSVGLSLATNSLDAFLQTGQPFVPTIDILRQLGKDDQVVLDVAATLEPMATVGIPSAAGLAQKLGDIEQSLQAAAAVPASDWLARTRENLTNLVDLHPADEEAVPGQNAVRDARGALLLQDLPGAVAAIRPLAEQGNEPSMAWVAAAEQRIAATEAVETLRQHLKTLLARQG